MLFEILLIIILFLLQPLFMIHERGLIQIVQKIVYKVIFETMLGNMNCVKLYVLTI